MHAEWGEGTQIEPAQPWQDPTTGEVFSNYGQQRPHLYMNITGEASRSYKQALIARRVREEFEARHRKGGEEGAGEGQGPSGEGGGVEGEGGGGGGDEGVRGVVQQEEEGTEHAEEL